MKYAPLDQIDAANFSRVAEARTWEGPEGK
jgi:hypothetical protein